MPNPTRIPMPNERIELPGGFSLRVAGSTFNYYKLYDKDGEVIPYPYGRVVTEAFAAAMNAAALQSPAGEWRDISTAPSAISAEPEDEVWVFGGRYTKPTLVQADGDWWRSSPMLGTARYAPTHWQPQYVPPSPTGEA